MSKAELEQNDDLMNFPGFKRIEVVEKYDLLADSQIKVSKIFGTTPTAIGSTNSIRELLGGAWEANIRYHHNFIYDRNLVPGLKYTIKDGVITPIEPDIDLELTDKLFEVFKDKPDEIKEMAKVYHPIFSAHVSTIQTTRIRH